MPAWGPSQGATSRAKSSCADPGVCSSASSRRYGLAWWVSALPAASASVFSAPLGRTLAPMYSAAEAGTAPAGSAEVPVGAAGAAAGERGAERATAAAHASHARGRPACGANGAAGARRDGGRARATGVPFCGQPGAAARA